MALGLGQRRLDRRCSRGEIIRCVDSNQHGQLLDRLAELTWACGLVANRTQMMFDQRVLDLGDCVHA
jgi:hypothetical protein